MKLSEQGRIETKSGAGLVRAIHQQLTEIGCFKDKMSSRFGQSTAVALRLFASRTDDKFYLHRPNMAAYRALRRVGGVFVAAQLRAVVPLRPVPVISSTATSFVIDEVRVNRGRSSLERL